MKHPRKATKKHKHDFAVPCNRFRKAQAEDVVLWWRGVRIILAHCQHPGCQAIEVSAANEDLRYFDEPRYFWHSRRMTFVPSNTAYEDRTYHKQSNRPTWHKRRKAK